MATHRVKKSGKDPPPFTRIDNSLLQDERLSFKARGLLAYMLSKPDHFRFYLDELIKHTTEKKDSIRTGMKELEQQRYTITRTILNKPSDQAIKETNQMYNELYYKFNPQ
ncbi:hypothetical protein MUG84_12730 [Paenibacillus sp. KQZ6P-2]|uniref:Uncharacterized protein n=1 Tax=Paenibacillus mangrovi TaxID=2931978 RepID=A0A9X1WNR4_9BACL|nr:hypothetical protein [Paenibacillus mangrovi]MCJ8012597.1 hypothetical protein [Paenibacillus mangrovi]